MPSQSLVVDRKLPRLPKRPEQLMQSCMRKNDVYIFSQQQIYVDKLVKCHGDIGGADQNFGCYKAERAKELSRPRSFKKAGRIDMFENISRKRC